MMSEDSRYTLTEEELCWAADLKAALSSQGVPIPTPDLLLAQFAIVGKGNTAKAVTRVKNYQKIAEGEYAYNTDAVAASDAAGFMNRRWPGAMLAAHELRGHPVVVHDAAAYKPSEVKEEGDLRRLIQGWLLLMDACSCDLERVRRGVVFVQSNKGVGWSNFSMEMEKRLAPIYQDCYPLRIAQGHMVDSGPLVYTLINLTKVFLSKKVRSRLSTTQQAGLCTEHGFSTEGLPPLLGGSCEGGYEEWLRAALERRAEAVKLVRIP